MFNSKEYINVLKVDRVIFSDPHALAEMIDKSFQLVFMKESNFNGVIWEEIYRTLDIIEVDMSETRKISVNLEMRKVMGLDVSKLDFALM